MSWRPKRMKFGLFLAPFHRVGEHPTLALQRDLELIETLDDLGYDEVWVGEHHSFGRELISNPMIFLAAAAERTKHIKLGTGVVSLPYHNPLMVADDLLQLDHMTRGRVALGVGPGALTSDAVQMGIPPETQRRRMAESLDAIMQMARNEEPVTMETDWFSLTEARLQMAWYSDPHPEVAVAVILTPAGPQLAGKHGVSMLSLGGADSDGMKNVWDWYEEAAHENGHEVSRKNWRVVTAIHVAETRAQAIEDVRAGYLRRVYVGDVRDQGRKGGIVLFSADTIEEAIDANQVIVGSPDDVIEQIEGIHDRSGGVGGVLGMHHEWASSDATKRSYELFMRYVAPRYQGQLDRIVASRDFVEDRQLDIFGAGNKAMAKAFADAGKEMPEAFRQGLESAEGSSNGAEAPAEAEAEAEPVAD
ncbi:MAG: LLM class flavin-dependent oxidoreductase [Chloroflexi bacterium]|nr:LLM class flavin-dependent oxidoreductase [Chloroflexota bacterium]